MKRLISLIAAAALLASMAGCGKKTVEPVMVDGGSFGAEAESDSAPAPSEEPTAAAGSFAMPFNSGYGWNPYTCLSMENQAVMNLIYEGLFTLAEDFTAQPVLCREYEVSEDGKMWTLTLREAQFSSGKTLNVDDVVYSLEKAEDSAVYGARFEDVTAYYASGTDEITIELSQPNDRLPCLLTFPIVPAFSLVDSGPAGTGPFVRESEDLLTVNEDWWQGADRLQIRSVRLSASVSAEDTRDNFEIDSVHLVYNNPNASTAATFHCDYELWNSPGTTMQFIGFNMGYLSNFSDVDLRAAITHCIDRVSIAEAVYHNFAVPASLPVAPECWLYDEGLAEQFAFTSVKAAQEELTATGYFRLPSASPSPSPSPSPEANGEEGEEPEAETPAASPNSIILLVRSGNLRRVSAAKQVAEGLTEIGFTVEVKEYEGDEFYYQLSVAEWDLYYDEVTLKPDFDLRPLLTSGGSLNHGLFSGSSELDALFDSSMENSGNCYDLYKLIMERGYLCPVLFLNNAVFTTRGVFTGLAPSPDNVFANTAEIRVEHGR